MEAKKVEVRIDGELMTDMASYAHRAWSGWMSHLFYLSHEEEDGSVRIPAALVERWKRQVSTAYENLPAHEQRSDIKEAVDIFSIFSGQKNDRREKTDREQISVLHI